MTLTDNTSGLADDSAVYRFLLTAPMVPVTISEWATGNILHVNDMAAALFGLPADAIIGRSMAEFYGDPTGRERFVRAIAENDGVTRMDLELRRADGGFIWVQAAGGRIRYRGIDAIIAIINDITVQKLREAELADASRKLTEQATDLTRLTAELRLKKHAAEAANAAKSSFLAHMSHELRSPLNAVLGFAEVVRDMHFGQDEIDRYRQYGGFIHQAGTHLLALIDDILDLAKVEAGKLDLQSTAFVLADLLDECARMMRSLAERRDVIFQVTLPPPTLLLTADRRRVKQMVVNLLSNAMKFTAGGGKVVLDVQKLADGDVAISITDTGIGMDADQVLVALEPFGRVQGAAGGDPTGTGLGLPIVRNLIEAHGGKLLLHSEPGKGTVARLIFSEPVG
jgi:two-component system cell cycle sensor histidine kinase PleC